jgi:hypothetical protein
MLNKRSYKRGATVDVEDTPTAGGLSGGTAASFRSAELQSESLGRGARLGSSNLSASESGALQAASVELLVRRGEKLVRIKQRQDLSVKKKRQETQQEHANGSRSTGRQLAMSRRCCAQTPIAWKS